MIAADKHAAACGDLPGSLSHRTKVRVSCSVSAFVDAISLAARECICCTGSQIIVKKRTASPLFELFRS